WTPVGGSKQVVQNSALGGASVTSYGNNVSTAPGTSSSIDSTAGGGAALGTLSLGNNSTLQVTNAGSSGSGNVSFTSTSLATAGGTYTLDSNWEVNLGQVSGSGTLNHSSAGAIVMETANLAGLGAGSVINMNGGTLGAVGNSGSTNPLGAANVNLLNGSGILLAARTGNVT